MLRSICILYLIMIHFIVMTQDIEEIIKAPIISTYGGFSLSQIGTHSTDTVQVTQPYAYYISANVNSKLYGVIDLPVSFSYTNNKSDYQTPNPFNHFSIVPSYKWIKTYMGYSSMEFSPYTLAGHEFLGGGIELTPGDNFKIMAMAGRLNQAVNPDSIGSEITYMKVGTGMKLEYIEERFTVGVNFFKAKDDFSSVNYTTYDSSFVKPEDNFTWGGNCRIKPFEKTEFVGEYGMSLINTDISYLHNKNDIQNFMVSREGELFTFHAYRGSLIQTTSIGKVGVSYERVDPNYRTLGTYYTNNDFENVTFDFSTSIKKWLTFAFNGGLQRNNLNNQNTQTNRRQIFSVNISSSVTEKLSLSGMFSNLSSYVNIRNTYDVLEQTNEFQNLDTLSFTQINLSASGNANYRLRATKSQMQSINIGFAYQETADIQHDDQKFIASKIYNSNIAYQFGLIKQKLNISTSVNHNLSKIPMADMNMLSSNLSVNKAFYDKIKTALSTTYSHTFTADNSDMKIINVRITAGYTIKKAHSINLNLAMVNRITQLKNSTQYSANLAYSYNFNFNLKRDNKKIKYEGNF